VFLLGDYPNASDRFGDRDLPDPTVGQRKEVNEDVVVELTAESADSSVVTVEPGVQRVLVEDWFLDPPFHLIAQQGAAPAGVDHYPYRGGGVATPPRHSGS
jgi:hypothetical protein